MLDMFYSDDISERRVIFVNAVIVCVVYKILLSLEASSSCEALSYNLYWSKIMTLEPEHVQNAVIPPYTSVLFSSDSVLVCYVSAVFLYITYAKLQSKQPQHKMPNRCTKEGILTQKTRFSQYATTMQIHSALSLPSQK